MRIHCTLLSMLLLAPLSGIQAQQAAAGTAPTHVVVRYFQCPMAGEAIRRFQEATPVVREMISEGKFVDYGLLTHNWGDEWNVVDYFVISGLDGFFTNFTELTQRINAANQARTAAAAQPQQRQQRQQQAQPQQQEERRPLSELCTAHKDNIYSIVQPPAPAASSP